jgi:hypothetical protein
MMNDRPWRLADLKFVPSGNGREGYDKRRQDREGKREILDFDSQWPPLEQH